jgi:predicted small lipoprotein YifL
MVGVLQILVSAPAPRRFVVAFALAVLAGCGQKGALYLPAGEAAQGRATLPETLTPSVVSPARAASGVPPSGTANPVRTP